jgi:hypothetical protein
MLLLPMKLCVVQNTFDQLHCYGILMCLCFVLIRDCAQRALDWLCGDPHTYGILRVAGQARARAQGAACSLQPMLVCFMNRQRDCQ